MLCALLKCAEKKNTQWKEIIPLWHHKARSFNAAQVSDHKRSRVGSALLQKKCGYFKNKTKFFLAQVLIFPAYFLVLSIKNAAAPC